MYDTLKAKVDSFGRENCLEKTPKNSLFLDLEAKLLTPSKLLGYF